MQKHNDWYRFALDDLMASRILLERYLIRIAAYHTQQSVEKALKAFLVYKNQDLKRTHDLVFLTRLCQKIDQTFCELTDLGFELNPYVVEGRYPQIDGGPTSAEQVHSAIVKTEKALRFVGSKLAIDV